MIMNYYEIEQIKGHFIYFLQRFYKILLYKYLNKKIQKKANSDCLIGCLIFIFV